MGGVQATDEPTLPTSDVAPNALDRRTLLIKPGQTFDEPLTRLRADQSWRQIEVNDSSRKTVICDSRSRWLSLLFGTIMTRLQAGRQPKL